MTQKHDEHGGVWKVSRRLNVDSQQSIRVIYMAHTSLGSVPTVMQQLGTMNRFRRQMGDTGEGLHLYMDRR